MPNPFLDPAVRNKPQEGDQDVNGERQARIDEGQDNREHVGHDRDLAFPIGSEGLSQLRVRPWARMMTAWRIEKATAGIRSDTP